MVMHKDCLEKKRIKLTHKNKNNANWNFIGECVNGDRCGIWGLKCGFELVICEEFLKEREEEKAK